MRRATGFTLVEAATAMAIMSMMTALAAMGMSKLQKAARLLDAKHSVIQLVNVARQRAQARGYDVYVVFSDLDSRSSNEGEAARVLLYEDPSLGLRGSTDFLGAIDADPNHVLDELSAEGADYRLAPIAFVQSDGLSEAGCDTARLPTHVGVTGDRLTAQECSAWCTFCEVQDGKCVGAVRFGSDGQMRIVTGAGATGAGGILKLVAVGDEERSSCLALSEPAGFVHGF